MVFHWAVPGNPFRGNAKKHKKLYEKEYNPQVVGYGPGIMLLAKARRGTCVHKAVRNSKQNSSKIW